MASDEGERKRPGNAEESDAEEAGSGLARWSAVGFEFGASVLLFFLLGSWLDAIWGTRPWLRVAGALLGTVAGTYLLVKQALRSDRTEDPPSGLKSP
jgi:F0F1-type ATP synthase assembly protein I